MFIDSIHLENLRNFRNASIEFVHPDQDFAALGLPKPQLANINLILGNNGWGKTTLLKAVALAALGPAARSSGIYTDYLVRREPVQAKREKPTKAVIEASFTVHEQDQLPPDVDKVESRIEIVRKGDLEELNWAHRDEKLWEPIFSANSDAFFFVGYGSTRRVQTRQRLDMSSLRNEIFDRGQRVESLFQDAYALIPLTAWQPNTAREAEIHDLINKLMGQGHYTFNGEIEANEYLFERGGLKVPFPVLSDGYRAFLGWIGDLLFHIHKTAPPDKQLRENRGIVMVDEIDLHLHPKWQMTVLETLAKELPNIQFIVTTHSPLIAGSLEWMNIISMQANSDQSSVAKRIEWAVHGLDADQILLTDFFGLESTRAPGKQRTLKELSLKARNGNTEAAKALLEAMSQGIEG